MPWGHSDTQVEFKMNKLFSQSKQFSNLDRSHRLQPDPGHAVHVEAVEFGVDPGGQISLQIPWKLNFLLFVPSQEVQ
jgi:hypothetical protein